MRNIKVWFSILVLIVGLAAIAPMVRADFGELEEDGGASRCNCWYPNSNTYGVIRDGDCPKVKCSVGSGELQ
jgi:hypothetical protein